MFCWVVVWEVNFNKGGPVLSVTVSFCSTTTHGTRLRENPIIASKRSKKSQPQKVLQSLKSNASRQACVGTKPTAKADKAKQILGVFRKQMTREFGGWEMIKRRGAKHNVSLVNR